MPLRGANCCIALGKQPGPIPLSMDQAYESDEIRQLTVELGYVPGVSHKMAIAVGHGATITPIQMTR